jgi:dihydrofolate reductase
MRRLIVEEWVSLDGFATDKNEKLDFFASTVRNIYKDEYYAKHLESIDCILFGKKSYQQFSALWPERTGDLISEKINGIEKIVFSTSLTNAPWGKWEAVNIVSTDLKSKITALKSLPGKNIVIWGSLSIAQQAMQDQLADELHIHICPVINGGGKRLFTTESQKALKLIHSKHIDSGILSLHYQL